MSRENKLRIVLQNPVDGLLYGLQKGKGGDCETVQPQLGQGEDIIFEFSIQVKQANGQGISLGGPFVQGSAGSRFVYINMGSYAGQAGSQWSGRLKVPLQEADFADQNVKEDEYMRACAVPGRTVDGKPVFATLKSFGGWSLHEISS